MQVASAPHSKHSGAPGLCLEWRERVADQVSCRQLVFQVCVDGRPGFIEGIALGETEEKNELV